MAWTDNIQNSDIGTAYGAAAGDALISYGDALGIFQSAMSGGVSGSEIDDLKLIFTNAGSQFASNYLVAIARNVLYGNPANTYWWGGATTAAAVTSLGNLVSGYSATQYARLLDKWFLGNDLPMPIAGGDAANGFVTQFTFSYGSATGPLFASGVAASDINQGYAGDCYLLAALGGLAQVKPNAITSMFTDNGNGTYGIRFYQGASEVYTTVDMDLPVTGSGTLAFGGNAQKSLTGESWVSLVEKGYAQLNAQIGLSQDGPRANSYQAIEGGWASPLKQVANLNYNYYSSYYTSIPDGYQLNTYVAESASTYKQTIINALTAGEVGWLGTFGETTGSNGKTNFVGGHAFMVLGYNASTDKFIIRNPWGGSGSGYNVQFEAPITEFWNDSVMGVIALTTGAAGPTYTYVATTNHGTGDPVIEGSPVTFTITRGSSGTSSTVYVSTRSGSASESDYASLTKLAVTFAANETVKTITVNTTTDGLVEGTESFSIDVFKNYSDTLATATVLAGIADATVPSYTYSMTSSAGSGNPATEGEPITFTITRGGSGSLSTVYVSTLSGSANGTDYGALALKAVTFAAYETSKTVAVNTFVDASLEGTESFNLQLFKAQLDTKAAATVTGYIKDAPVPSYTYQISSATSSTSPVTEGGTITFTITRSGSGSESTIYLDTVSGTAGPTDYAGLTDVPLKFESYQTVKTVQVGTTVDWWQENVEYFDLRAYASLNDAVGAYLAAGTAYIADKAVDSFNYTVVSNATTGNPVGEGGPITFTITRDGTGAASTVYVSTSPGSAGNADYAALNKLPVTFAAYETSKSIVVDTLTDSLVEGSEYFWLDLFRNASDSSYTTYASAYIADKVAPSYNYTVTSSAGSGNAATEGTPITFTITRGGTGSASTVYVSTTPGSAGASDYAELNKLPVSFAPYETTKTVTVNTLTDSLVEGSEYFWLDLFKNFSDSSYATYASGYIADKVAPSYNYTVTSSADAGSPAAEGTPITFTITRGGTGSESTVYVSTTPGSAGASDYAELSKLPVSFASYETTKTVTVNTLTDSLVEGAEYFWLDLFKNFSDPVYATYSSGYIADSIAPSYNYSIASSAPFGKAATEGSPITFTITRDASGSVSTVYVTTTSGSAGGSDYVALNKKAVTFAANQLTQTVIVETRADSIVEGEEYFWLDLFKTYSDVSYTTFASGYIKDAASHKYAIQAKSPDGLNEGSTGTTPFSFTVTRSGDLSVGSTVAWAVSGATSSPVNSADFASNELPASTLSFLPGQAKATITVNVAADTSIEPDEGMAVTVWLPGDDPTKGSYASTVILDDDNPVNNQTMLSTKDDDQFYLGGGSDTVIFDSERGQNRIGVSGNRVRVHGPDGYDDLKDVEFIKFDDTALITVETLRNTPGVDELMSFLTADRLTYELPLLYDGPLDLRYVYPGTSGDDVVGGTTSNDFMNLAGGNDAMSMGDGNDIADGGGGSNFLTGGAGLDVFYLDGRFLVPVWSCITDWQPNEQLVLWGWQPGISKAAWSESDGLPGWTGATMFADIDGNGLVETAVTWTGLALSDLPPAHDLDGLRWFY